MVFTVVIGIEAVNLLTAYYLSSTERFSNWLMEGNRLFLYVSRDNNLSPPKKIL